MLLPMLLLAGCLTTASGQRYADRNVLPDPEPPPPVPPPASEDYEYEYGDDDLYGFRGEEEEPDVYKWTVDQYPHPVDTPRFCNRLRASHVCDPDLVLEREQADLLDESIDGLHRSTPCICDACDGHAEEGGIVVGIALMKHLRHPYHVHHAKVIRSFAEALRVRWKLGRCDNDILVVVATADRLSYTDVGRFASDYLSVHEAHRIFLENKAQFSASNFSAGLADILAGYRRVTRDMRRRLAKGASDLDVGPVVGIIVGSALVLGALLFLGVLAYRRCRGAENTEVKDRELSSETGSAVSSSWSKKDIKVLFGPEKSARGSSAKYRKCGTDENEAAAVEEEDELDFTLATPDDTSFPSRTRLTEVTSDSEALERDLETAAEGLVKTFPSPNGRSDVQVTDM